MKITLKKLEHIIREELQKVQSESIITETKYKKTYKSIIARDKDYLRIFGPVGGHPRVRVRSYNEMEKTGRMKTSYIEIEGDKVWVDAYKKIAFEGNGEKGDVIDFVRKQTGNSNESVNEKVAMPFSRHLRDAQEEIEFMISEHPGAEDEGVYSKPYEAIKLLQIAQKSLGKIK